MGIIYTQKFHPSIGWYFSPKSIRAKKKKNPKKKRTCLNLYLTVYKLPKFNAYSDSTLRTKESHKYHVN